MEILGGLVRLDRPNELPAPWFNRPSLGLVTNTPVRIAVVTAADKKEAPPDIIVTPLHTSRMYCTASVTIDFKERTGAVFETLSEVKRDFNIALAETLTIDQRSRHRITLLLEPPGFTGAHSEQELDREIESFESRLSKFEQRIMKIDGFIKFQRSFVLDRNTKFERQDTSVVQNGAISYAPIREWLLRTYQKEFSDRFDFKRVIVSSSVDARFIRYIFPKRGVFAATISHLDVPTALAQLTRVFHDSNDNILLSRLSRSVGGLPTPGKSIYVTICEPSEPPSQHGDEIAYEKTISAKITEKLNECDPNGDYQFVLNTGSVSLGNSIDFVAYPQRHKISPGVHEIKAQTELLPFLDQYNLRRQRAVFFSYRAAFLASTQGARLTDAIEKAAKGFGATVYDGFSRPRTLQDEESADVRARLWMASAGIFFGHQIPNSDSALSPNQLIEWAYMYGQGKQWVVVVDEKDVRGVEHFMIPKRSFITYSNLNTDGAIREVVDKVNQALDRWFATPTTAFDL